MGTRFGDLHPTARPFYPKAWPIPRANPAMAFCPTTARCTCSEVRTTNNNYLGFELEFEPHLS